jgi:hypothetical protein
MVKGLCLTPKIKFVEMGRYSDYPGVHNLITRVLERGREEGQSWKKGIYDH